MAVGTVGGPLLGGFLTDSISWRWNFYVALPFAVLAAYLVMRNLHLPKRPAMRVQIDYLGIVLISAGVSTLLLWVTFAGDQFAWSSVPSLVMAIGAVALLTLAVWWELRAPNPLIPLSLFRNRTFTLAVIASLATGVAMFGASVFLSQYMQLARGATPTQAGIMTIPMMAGLLIASTTTGQLVSRYGRWKGFVVTGAVLMVLGNVALSFLHYDTSYWIVAVGMGILGTGVGMTMQNLVIVTQNSVEVSNLGVATSSIAFFRSLGGSVGVSVMGAILGNVVASQLTAGIAQLPASSQAAAASALADGSLPSLSELPEAVRVVVETAYGLGTARVFLAAIPIAVLTLIAVLLLPNNRLGLHSGIERTVLETMGESTGAETEAGTDAGTEVRAETALIEDAAPSDGSDHAPTAVPGRTEGVVR